MEKLSSILAIVRDASAEEALIDKVVALARRSGATLELLLCQPSQVSALAARCARLGYDDIVTYALHGSDDPLPDVVLERLRQKPADLVVKSPAGPRSLRRFPKESEDFVLCGQLPVPLLLSGPRPWPEEPRFAAAVDVSDRESESLARATLETGAWLSLGCKATFDVLYSEREAFNEAERMARAVKLAQLVREFRSGAERLEILNGAPDITLPPVLAKRRYDLVVLGAVPRHLTMRSFVHSLTSRLTESTVGDVLLVKPEFPHLEWPGGESTGGKRMAREAERYA